MKNHGKLMEFIEFTKEPKTSDFIGERKKS